MRAALTALFALVLLALTAGAQADTVEYLHTDVLGNVVAVTDENANVIERRVYEPYGLPEAPIPDGPGFTGHDMDGETGLVYMQQRYYDPEVGRFLSPDPMAVDPSTAWNFNRYNYAANNPYRYTDPDGQAACVVLPPLPACVVAAIKAAEAVTVVLVGAGTIFVSNKIVDASVQPDAADTAEDARAKVVEGTRPARGRSGEKGEREGDGGREGREESWGSVNAPESSPRPGVRVKELADGGRAETHDSTKSRDYPQGTPTIKIQDADGNVTDTVRFPEDDR